VREYCGISLSDRSFYIGSTKEINRRLRAHEKANRIGGPVLWLIGSEHEDPLRAEEQYYLDFYFNFQGCLNLSPNSQLGNFPPSNSRISEAEKEKISLRLRHNKHGAANAGSKFYYDPITLEVRRIRQDNKPPPGWKLGNPKLAEHGAGYSWWKDEQGKKVKVYPGDDTSGLISPAHKRKQRTTTEHKSSRRKKF